jgi:hypothetical protein
MSFVDHSYRTAETADQLTSRPLERMVGLAKRIPGWLVVAAASTVGLLPQLSRPGPEMDEGMVLAYAVRVLQGAIPYRDFETFYGPGNLWDVAGAFAVLGTHQHVERLVGLVYAVATITSMYVLVRRSSRGAAIASVMIAIPVAGSAGVWAYATRAAVAFLMLSIVLATREAGSARSLRLQCAAAGFLAGWTLLCRFDFAVSVILVAAFVLIRLDSRARMYYSAALAAAALLYIPYLVLSGTESIRRIERDLMATTPGRHLPLPTPWTAPVGGLFAGGVLALALLGVATALLWRRVGRDAAAPAAAFVAVAGAVPLALSRTDIAHVEPLALVSFGLLPLAATELRRHVQTSRILQYAVALLVSLSVIWGVGPFAIFQLGTAIGASGYGGVKVTNGGRSFILDKRDAGSAQSVVTAAAARARAGQLLFAGPYDLRLAGHGPTYLYFLLPTLRPASYFMEFNPWTANRPGSGLTQDIRRADWLILVSKWDAIREPNSSTRLGPAAPNTVVRQRFRLIVRRGFYRLYEARR